jgi:hypothetical protein
VSQAFLQNAGVLWNISRTWPPPRHYPVRVATKYYTHFVTGTDTTQSVPGNEWSGVVELREPLTQGRANRELRSLLAQSFDLDSDEIRILHWARLH